MKTIKRTLINTGLTLMAIGALGMAVSAFTPNANAAEDMQIIAIDKYHHAKKARVMLHDGNLAYAMQCEVSFNMEAEPTNTKEVNIYDCEKDGKSTPQYNGVAETSFNITHYEDGSWFIIQE